MTLRWAFEHHFRPAVEEFHQPKFKMPTAQGGGGALQLEKEGSCFESIIMKIHHWRRETKKSKFDLLTLNGFLFVCLFVYYFVCLREVKTHLPSNDSLSQDDFVLMTLFPQRRISEMESTLESAGKTVRYWHYVHLGLEFFLRTYFAFKLCWLLETSLNYYQGRWLLFLYTFNSLSHSYLSLPLFRHVPFVSQ